MLKAHVTEVSSDSPITSFSAISAYPILLNFFLGVGSGGNIIFKYVSQTLTASALGCLEVFGLVGLYCFAHQQNLLLESVVKLSSKRDRAIDGDVVCTLFNDLDPSIVVVSVDNGLHYLGAGDVDDGYA